MRMRTRRARGMPSTLRAPSIPPLDVRKNKNMKKSILLILFSSLLVCSSFAGNGNAIVPFWVKLQDAGYSYIVLTNISNENVTVQITLKDANGVIYNENTEPGANISTEENFIGNPVSAEGAVLEAGKMGLLAIRNVGDLKRGYGIIKWSSAMGNSPCLVGFWGTSVLDADLLPMPEYQLINNGQPF